MLRGQVEFPIYGATPCKWVIQLQGGLGGSTRKPTCPLLKPGISEPSGPGMCTSVAFSAGLLKEFLLDVLGGGGEALGGLGEIDLHLSDVS